MKKTFISLFLLIAFSVSGFSQIDKIVGKWKTIDDEDGKAKSIVLIFKATNGKEMMKQFFSFMVGKATHHVGKNFSHI